MERGAFFGSIEKTLNHLLWADRMWMSRFWPARVDKPAAGIKDSVGLVGDWPALGEQRRAMDDIIIEWAGIVGDEWLSGDLTWFSGAIGAEVTRPAALCATHLFNHQTHHRGQVHAMLTAAGARPEDTDLFLMPED